MSARKSRSPDGSEMVWLAATGTSERLRFSERPGRSGWSTRLDLGAGAGFGCRRFVGRRWCLTTTVRFGALLCRAGGGAGG
jgi:hypothetical protein